MPTLKAAPARKLDYDFTTTPSTIHASAPGVDPNTISLHVIVSNPSRASVEMSKITIDIPLGEEVSRDLSNTTTLPTPEPRVSGSWTISTENGTITISPTDGESEKVNVPITFSLTGIVVNQTPGTVPLMVTEFPPSDPKFSDDKTYSLVKEPADIPPIHFYTVPETVTEPGQSVTLHWTSQKQDERSTFGLRIASVQATAARQVALTATPFKSCVADGDCYTWQDGINGVVGPAVYETVTFALDVVQARSTGERRIVESLQTTVPTRLPRISQNSYLRASPTGRFVSLHWLAENAHSCSVLLDGHVIADNAPMDTYQQGYPVTLMDGAPSHQLAVVAHAASGSAQATFTFPLVSHGDPVILPLPAQPRWLAVSPDYSVALIGYASKTPMTVINAATWTAESATIPVGEETRGIVFTPDGTRAFVACELGGVFVIDVKARTADSNTIPVVLPMAAAITPDGSTLLVAGGKRGESALTIIDVATRQVLGSVPLPAPGLSAAALSLSADGTRAVAVTSSEIVDAGKVFVIDVPNRKVTGSVVVAKWPDAVVVTPDGSSALVANFNDAFVSLIDTASAKVVTTIATGPQPRAIAAMPDGSRVLVVSRGERNLTIITLSDRSTVNVPIPDGQLLSTIAIAPDGSAVLIGDFGNDRVVVL